jgi:hypothetical protein
MKMLGIIAGGALTLGLLTGCGSDGDSDAKVVSLATGGPSASATTTQSSAEKNKAFAQCLRDNGLQVDDPDPTTGRINRDSFKDADQATMTKALQACRDKMPQEMVNRVTNPDAATLEKMRGFAQCMRDQGLDFADPGPNGFDFKSFDRSKPGFTDAAAKCQKTNPFFTQGGGQ